MATSSLEEGLYEIHQHCSRLELPPDAAENLSVLALDYLTFYRRKPHLWRVRKNKDGTYSLQNEKAKTPTFLGIDSLGQSNHIAVVGTAKPRRWELKPYGSENRFFIVLAGEAIMLNEERFELVVDLPNWHHPKTALRPLESDQRTQSWVFMKYG